MSPCPIISGTSLMRMNLMSITVVGVTDSDNRLVGLLTIENLGEMMMVHSARPDAVNGPWKRLS
jgi:stage IV sporulation protein FB